MSKIQDRPLSIPKFTFKVVALTVGMLFTIRFGLPNVWRTEVSLGWWLILVLPLTIFVQHVGLAGFEWAFHRWVLHNMGIFEWLFNRPGLRWLFRMLAGFKASHEGHHGRTAIVTRDYELGPNRIVLSDYAMDAHEKFEASAFPKWSLLGFWAFFSIVLVPLHLLLPNLPILIGGYTAVALSYWMYEVFHSIHHYPDEWWKTKIEDPKYGEYWRRRYAFHQFHHYLKKTNLGVSCVLGFEWWDHWLGTYHYPQNLLIDRHVVTADDLAYHPPRAFIVRIDDWVNAREARYRAQQRAKHVA